MSIQKRIRQLQQLGWDVKKTPGGHLKLTHPNAAYPVFTACTSVSVSGWLNTLAQMRRALRAGAAQP
jgi:predicted RNA binding protein YcfA (HicA-like mRNA interferase family)